MDYLTIVGGVLTFQREGEADREVKPGDPEHVLPNSFMVSSSIDFPEDETTDEKVIAYCRWLRRPCDGRPAGC